MGSPPQSNNPFRASMLPPPEEYSEPEQEHQPQEQPQQPLSSTIASCPPIYKSPSTTTTIAEAPRFSQESYPASDLANARTATVSTTSLPMASTTMQTPKDKEVVITVHHTTSQVTMPTEPPPTMPRKSCVGDRSRISMQVDESGMWPARRLLQKQHADKKRMWIFIKIGIAMLIIGVAVAVGLGISKAVRKN
ncbi:hypothetical protein BZA05DRAFT_67381 [Tricharina praecox]|uniref:uncharacterized protein n=1 Tax=Tricharina praecox TaxID=43433 RepID=UPI00221FDFCC|nr:uncharacterized protein BZA05DRAFT_67381 [Tricharina praecox]KAI5850051.1 hypothetical protein BZA05DRAFT_67381 [Tricharina praecox]